METDVDVIVSAIYESARPNLGRIVDRATLATIEQEKNLEITVMHEGDAVNSM